jgi:hypothetical protein
MLLKEEMEGRIHGFKAALGCGPVYHMMFADDLVIFAKASREELEAVQKCLEAKR